MKLADIYLDGFKRTQLVGMLGTPAVPRALARGCNLGWRAECFGDLCESHVKEVPRQAAWNHTYDSYIRNICSCGLQVAWKTAPLTMESCSTVESWSVCGYDLDRIIEEDCKYHTSVFMAKSACSPEQMLEKPIACDRRIVYRFALCHMLLLLAVNRSGGFAVFCFADNVGSAPIYWPYSFAMRRTQGRTERIVRFAVDLRTWPPGRN